MRVDIHDERAFERWLRSLGKAQQRRIVGKLYVVATLGGAKAGMPLVRSLGGGLYELRTAGLRVYFIEIDQTMCVLAAGRKDTQVRDIARARRRMP
jgi:putative addiction module killer protein